jgi:hypothetical protein
LKDFIVQAVATLVGALAAFALEALRRSREERQVQIERFKTALFVLILQRTFLRSLWTQHLEPLRESPIRAYALHPILAVPAHEVFDLPSLSFLLSGKEAELLNTLGNLCAGHAITVNI